MIPLKTINFIHMKNRLSSFLLCIIISATGQAQISNFQNNPGQKPKVVIGLLIENMRPDYVQRFWDKFEDNGFKKLYSKPGFSKEYFFLEELIR